jgi:uncharacterized protein (TIGR02266 family)
MAKKSKKRAKNKKRTMLPPGLAKSSPAPLEALAAEVPAPPGAPAQPPHEEHRASPRTSLAVELHLASESHFFTGLSGDISEGGVFVSTYRELAVGSLVDIEFSLPGSDRTLHARGEVRWHRDASPDVPPGVGIAFEELPDEDRALIHRFCSLRPPLYYDDVG